MKPAVSPGDGRTGGPHVLVRVWSGRTGASEDDGRPTPADPNSGSSRDQAAGLQGDQTPAARDLPGRQRAHVRGGGKQTKFCLLLFYFLSFFFFFNS